MTTTPTTTVDTPAGAGLSSEDRELLEFERVWWRHPGAKLQAIRDRYGSPVGYFARLNRLLGSPAAAAEYPALVARLCRARDAQLARRGVRR